MRLKEKKLLKKFAATLKKFSAQGAKKVEYGRSYFHTGVQIFKRLKIENDLNLKILFVIDHV